MVERLREEEVAAVASEVALRRAVASEVVGAGPRVEVSVVGVRADRRTAPQARLRAVGGIVAADRRRQRCRIS